MTTRRKFITMAATGLLLPTQTTTAKAATATFTLPRPTGPHPVGVRRRHLGAVRTHLSDPEWAKFWHASTGWRLDLAVPKGRHYTYTDVQWFLPQLNADPTGLIGTVDCCRAHPDMERT